ncbi:hypothetical protein [Myroides odoratus]|uniref:hypothetical protein n=1 Tax=Myroides odoratus TaxID=256 RepID=UPI0039AF7780
MNTSIKTAINSFIKEATKSFQKITPLGIEITKYYDSPSMEAVVLEIDKDIEATIKANKPLLEKRRLKDIEKGFNFTLKTCLNNGMELEQFKDLLYQNSGILLDENELELALSNPKDVIVSKVDYKADSEIEKVLVSSIGTFDHLLSDNTIYTQHKRAFALAVILIDNEFEKASDPVEAISNDYSILKEFCLSKGYDLMSDPQFSSYKIITIDDKYELVESYPARIYNKDLDTTIFLNGIENHVFEYLIQLSKTNIFQLSLKPSSLYFIDGYENATAVYEHLETGKYFHIDNFKGNLLTKLYNESYDNLWIKIDGNDLTFEEIIQDFKIYEDMVVTQVLHSQFITEGSNFYITHLDHEFIFYTLEEFENRLVNPIQKGEAMTRIKTFKIDGSKILVNDHSNILFTILGMKFKNTELIKEYFNKIEEDVS